jgi:hypothetical protein
MNTTRLPTFKPAEAVCSCSSDLRWVSGMFYWVKYVQSYNRDGWNYFDEIKKLSIEISTTQRINDTSTIISIDCILKTGSDHCDSAEDMTDRLLFILSQITAFNITNTTSSPSSDPPSRMFNVSDHAICFCIHCLSRTSIYFETQSFQRSFPHHLHPPLPTRPAPLQMYLCTLQLRMSRKLSKSSG